MTIKGDYQVVVPIEISESRKALIKERDSVYGRKLSYEQWIEIGSLKPADILIPQMIMRDLDDIFWSDLLKRLRKYPNFGSIAIGYSPDDWPSLFGKYKKALTRTREEDPTPLEVKEQDQEIIVPHLAPQETSFLEEEEEINMIVDTFVEYQDQMDLEFIPELGYPPDPPDEPPPDMECESFFEFSYLEDF